MFQKNLEGLVIDECAMEGKGNEKEINFEEAMKIVTDVRKEDKISSNCLFCSHKKKVI